MMLKLLLCYKDVVFFLEELVNGEFKWVIGEIDEFDVKKVKCVVFCVGKVYYDLLVVCCEKKIKDIVIVCIE